MQTKTKLSLEQHAMAANAILGSIHDLCRNGAVNLRSGEWSDWPFDRHMIEALFALIPKMRPVSKTDSGQWDKKEVQTEYPLPEGTLSVWRDGPFGKICWRFDPINRS